jgi:hypothetical protein
VVVLVVVVIRMAEPTCSEAARVDGGAIGAGVGRGAYADTWPGAVYPSSGDIRPDEPFRLSQNRLSPEIGVLLDPPGNTGASSLALHFSTIYKAEKTPAKASLHGGSS